MKQHHYATALLALASLVSPICSQMERANRVVRTTPSTSTDALDWIGGDFAYVAARGSLHNLQSAPSLSGDAEVIANPAGEVTTVLLAGRDSASNLGVFVINQWDSAQQSMLVPPGGIHQETGADFVGIAWDPAGVVFLLDARNARVVVAPYTPGDSAPSQWAILADSSVVPALADASSLTMDFCSPNKLLLTNHGEFVSDTVEILLSASGVTSSLLPQVGSRASGVEADECVVGATSLDAYGPSGGATVNVIRMTGPGAPFVLGSGLTDSAGRATVTLSSPIAFGDVLGTSNSQLFGSQPPYVAGVFRDGSPERVGSGLEILPFSGLLGGTAYDGNALFEVPLRVVVSDPTGMTFPQQYGTGLTVSFSGTIVNYPGSTRRVLLPDASVSSTIKVRASTQRAYRGSKLSIPANSGLAGSVVYFQWIILNGSTLSLSDIIGIYIQTRAFQGPDPWVGGSQASLMSGGRSGGPQPSASRSADERIRSQDGWLRSNGLERMNSAQRSEWMRGLGMSD